MNLPDIFMDNIYHILIFIVFDKAYVSVGIPSDTYTFYEAYNSLPLETVPCNISSLYNQFLVILSMLLIRRASPF